MFGTTFFADNVITGSSGGVDGNTGFMLHADTALTDSSPVPKTVTTSGAVAVDTGTKKWGAGSAAWTTEPDMITFPSASNTEMFSSLVDSKTIDGQWRVTSATIGFNNYFLLHYLNGTNFYYVTLKNNGSLEMYYIIGGVEQINVVGSAGDFTIGDGNFYHVAVCKKADKVGVYVGGVQKLYGTFATAGTVGGTFGVATDVPNSLSKWRGWLDEFRFQNTNWFNANPNAGLTDTIVVPTGPYT